jgi:hypothetical protein
MKKNPYCTSCKVICEYTKGHWWTCKSWVVENARLNKIRDSIPPSEISNYVSNGDARGISDAVLNAISTHRYKKVFRIGTELHLIP